MKFSKTLLCLALADIADRVCLDAAKEIADGRALWRI